MMNSPREMLGSVNSVLTSTFSVSYLISVPDHKLFHFRPAPDRCPRWLAGIHPMGPTLVSLSTECGSPAPAHACSCVSSRTTAGGTCPILRGHPSFRETSGRGGRRSERALCLQSFTVYTRHLECLSTSFIPLLF